MGRECKLLAREACKYTKNKLAGVYFVYTLLIGLFGGSTASLGGANEITLSSGCFAAEILLFGPLYLGLINVIRLNYHGMNFSVQTLFTGFGNFLDTVAVTFLKEMYAALWGLLLFVPGIIKRYSYAMAIYVHAERSELTPKECITESRVMMDGHKWELFCLDLSYIGWYLLIVLTFGILAYWVAPEIETAHYVFYRKINYRE